MNPRQGHSPALALAGHLERKTSAAYRTFSLWIALAAMMGNAACTGFTGQPVFKGGGGGGTKSQPPVTQPSNSGAQLSANTTQLNFGNITVGSSTSQIVTLTDIGNADATISGLSANGAGFSVSSGSSVTLDPTQSVNIYVSFNPSTPGSASGNLTIVSNSVNSSLTVGLSGNGVAANVQHSVGLTWAPSSSPVIGYFVYRGVSPNALSRLIPSVDPSPSYTDQSVTGGQTYVYAVTSVDSSNIESGFSNQVSVTVPNN
jgi:hypothetical protein